MTFTGHFEPSLTGVLAVQYFLVPRPVSRQAHAILDQVVPTKGELVAWTTAPKPSRDRPLA